MRLLLALALLAACAPAAPRSGHPPAPCSSWGTLPLVLGIDPSAAEYRAEIASAARAWDDALGRPAFVFRYVDAAHVDVLVEVGVVEHDIPRAVETSSACPAGRLATRVTLAPALSGPGVYAFAEHGLGHALGLPHATNEQSVMQHVLDVGLMSTSWDADHDPPHYRITETDAERALELHLWPRAVWLSSPPSWRAPLRPSLGAAPYPG